MSRSLTNGADTMSTMNTQPKRKPITMTLPENLVAYLDEYANDRMLSRSAAATQIILQHTKQQSSKGEEQ